MAEDIVAPNTIEGQFNQYIKPAIRVPQQGEPGYEDISKDLSSRYPSAAQVSDAGSVSDIPTSNSNYPQMDPKTQEVLLGAANPPKFEAPQNGLSNVPPQQEEVQQYPSDFKKTPEAKPADKSDIFAPFDKQISAQKDLNIAAQTLEKNKQEQIAITTKLQEERVNQYAKLKATYDTELNTRMMEIDKQLEQVNKDAIEARKSTSDLFAEKSSGQKIAAGIAMILGVAHAGLGGGDGGNRGVQVIEKALQDDRNTNLQRFAQSKEMLNLRRQNADDYAEKMMRQETIADKQLLLQMQVVQTKFQQAESVYRGSAAGAQAKNAIAAIEMQKNALKQQLAQQAALSAMASSGSLENLNPLQTLGLPENVRKAVEATRELKVPGYSGVALSKEDRDQFQKYRQTTEPAINGLQRILDLQKNGSRLNPIERAKMASEVNAATGALREAIVGPGAMTEKEYNRLLATIGDPNKLFSLPAVERAKAVTALGKLKSDLNTIANSRGLKPPAEFSTNFKPMSKEEADKLLKKYSK